MAVTATANVDMRASIVELLKMQECKFLIGSIDRSNLQYRVVCKNRRKPLQTMIDLIKNDFNGKSGIVYCMSRSETELVSETLNQVRISCR